MKVQYESQIMKLKQSDLSNCRDYQEKEER